MSSFPLPRGLVEGGLAGLFVGVLLVLQALGAGGQDLIRSLPEPAAAAAIVLRSFALFPLLGGGAGLVVGALCVALSKLPRASWLTGPGLVLALTLGVGTGLLLFAELTVRGQISGLGGLALDHPARRAMAVEHSLWSLGLALVVFALAKLVATLIVRRRWQLAPRRRFALLGLAIPLLALVLADLMLWRRGEARDGQPERVVIVGLDGMTLRVLGPLLRRSELPTFSRLLEEGAWGTLLTYGTASSPQVWTTLATGRKVRDHGIDDFVTWSGYRATPLKSYDRQVPALWNMIGGAGGRVAIVNWLVTFPPEPVSGFMVPRTADRIPRTYPEELRQELEPYVTEPGGNGAVRRSHIGIDRVFDVAEHLLPRGPFDLLALYDNASDSEQHRSWRDYEPDAFDPALWPAARPERAELIPDVYRHVDRRLGRLLELLPDKTLLLVVSDHGQQPAGEPRVRLELDRLLAALGYLELDESGRPDFAAASAYALTESLWKPTLRVDLNLRGREPQGRIERQDAEHLIARLTEQLACVTFTDGRPLFDRLEPASLPDGPRPGGADLLVFPSARLRDARIAEERILIHGEVVPLLPYLEIDTTISGAHQRQGILFAWGPGVRPGYAGQRVLTTPFHTILRHLTGKLDAVDVLLPTLRSLGLIDRATTLDLAPTVLWILGLPVARNMPGRPLRDLFAGGPELHWTKTYAFPQRITQRETAPPRARDAETRRRDASDRKVLERLRALGYID